MPHNPLPPDKAALILRLWHESGIRSERKICRIAGVHWTTVRRVLRDAGLKPAWKRASVVRPEARAETRGETLPSSPPTPAATAQPHSGSFSREESADASRIEFASDVRIRTLEDAIAYAEVDTAVWRVDRWECTSWESALKVREFGEGGKVKGETPLTRSLWRVKLYLKRILAKPLADAMDAIFERMKSYSPKYAPIPSRRQSPSPHLLEIAIADPHFAKLAWEPETGTNYDLKIAETVYKHAVEDLLDRTSGFAIERILFPVGNDFFHIDNANNTTTAGTIVDTDGRYAKIYETGFMAVIWAVELLRRYAPVEVVWIPGNHDRTISYHLVKEISTWFRLCNDVRVDHGPKVRKYHKYGKTLIGLSHGHLEKHSSLPVIMATEQREAWAATTNHEWHLGHRHQSKRIDTVGTDTIDGVTIRTLRSLAGSDFWHFSQGYLSTQRAAEAFLYARDSGFAGHFNVNVRE